MSLSGLLSTNNAPISFTSPVTLAGDLNLTSGTTAGPISFQNTVDGNFNLTLTSGLADLSFASAVGSITPLASITIPVANNVTFNGVTTTSITQATGTGKTTLNGLTTTSGPEGILLSTESISLNQVTTTGGGPLALTNGGLLSLTGLINVSGGFTQDGAGSTILSNTLQAAGTLFFKSGVSVSGNGELISLNQPIILSSTLDGPGNISFNAGTSDISIAANAGMTTALGTVTFANARNISLETVAAASLVQTAGTGTTTIMGDVNTNTATGIQLNGTAFVVEGSWTGARASVQHTDASSFAFGPATLLSGPFLESGTGAVSVSGLIHANNANITFTNPINLTAATTLNSDGAGDIVIMNTVDGNQTLDLVAGSGNIFLDASIGGVTPITSLVIESANNVTTEDISSGLISQLAGTGLSDFGTLTTTSISGINLVGNQFTFDGPVTTTANGPVIITNSGLLTIPLGSPFNLTSTFSQLGAGNVTLCDAITTTGDAISFNSPVFLCSDVALNTGNSLGNITFASSLTGMQTLQLTAGFGTISFAQPVGPLNVLQVINAGNFTSNSIGANSIDIEGVTTLITLNGPLTTGGSTGVTLAGNAITINNSVTTTGGGLTITNTGLLTLLPNATLSIDGPLNQNGSGNISGGGSIQTNNQPVQFASPFMLTGPLNVSSQGADILVDEVNGLYNLTLQAGAGDVTAAGVIGGLSALNNVVVNGANIHLNGIGTTANGVAGALTLTATDAIDLLNSFYSANNQTYTAANGIFLNTGSQVNFTTFGTPIIFANPVQLSSGNDLNVVTNNGNFSFNTIQGTTFENITIDTGSGNALLGTILSGNINNVGVNAGLITFAGPINAVNTDFTSQTNIFNAGSTAYAITSTNSSSFNALTGDVGSKENPISVNTSNQIFAGAGQPDPGLAAFTGSSSDNTVNSLLCLILPASSSSMAPRLQIVLYHPFPLNRLYHLILRLSLLSDPALSSPIRALTFVHNLSSYLYFWPDFIDAWYFYDCISVNDCEYERCD